MQAYHWDLLSTYYVLGGVNRMDLIFALPELGTSGRCMALGGAGDSLGPDVPSNWSALAARTLSLLCQAY